MAYKLLKRCLMLFGCVLFSFLLLKMTFSTSGSSSVKSVYDVRLKEQLVEAQKRISSLEDIIKLASGENNKVAIVDQLVEAQQKIQTLENKLKKHDLLYEIEKTIPATRKLERDVDLEKVRGLVEDQVTLVMFSFEESHPCLENRLDTIAQNYPRLKLILVYSSPHSLNISSHQVTIEYVPNVRTEGKALEILASKVKTKYFLFMASGTSLASYKSDQSVSWLFHALETLPELDFVGGSYLQYDSSVNYPVYEAPCYRMRICNWTFSQTMEYRYSVGDMMVCEETSSSFMGKTASIQKVGPFDPNLNVMATTDFFFRARGKAVVGLRPEVFFSTSRACATSVDNELKVAFMNKHQVYILKDSLGRKIKAAELKNFKSIQDKDEHWVKTNTYAKPYFNEGLRFNLEVGADYFESQNISYYLDGGVSLGAVKVRGFLPWDSGDIDLGYLADWKDVKRGLEEYGRKKGIKVKVTTSPMGGDKQELLLVAGNFGINTMFQQEQDKANQDLYMYIYIHGRRYPVLKELFRSLRGTYGMNYLEMHGYYKGRMKCTLPGHHACVPEEFSMGAGHWRDYYCQI